MPLSFFTNSGNSFGSALPFQRIVEPAQLGFFLNLEQAELLRIQRYNEGWRFYFGKQWLFKRDDGEPLVTFNYYRKIIDKAVEFLVSKGFVIRTAEALEEITKPFLDEVWEYNKRDQISWDIGTTGSVTGDVFLLITFEEPSPMQKRINPFSQGQVRINLLGSEQVYPTWDPLNTDTLVAVRIETVYYAERGTRQLDREDRVNHEGRQLYTKRFTQIITRDQIVEQYHGDMPFVRPNVLGEIPVVHIKNISLPKEYYGLPDGQDLIDLQRELNEKATDISDIVNYYAAPLTAVFGAKAKQLDRGPRNIWTGLPKDSRIEVITLPGDLTAAKNYVDFVKKALHELSDTPEGALGAMQPISNTSGVALHMMYQPLIGKTKRKKAQYEPGLEQVNYFILRIAMMKGLISLPYDICKHCGGRIIEIENGKKTKVWDPTVQQFVEIPIKTKRCYHIDKQTLEFTDPFEMRVKWWRQYGFGNEVREQPYNQVIFEIQNAKRSFWDWSQFQEESLEAWRQENAGVIAEAHAKQIAEQNAIMAAQNPSPVTGPDGSVQQPTPQLPLTTPSPLSPQILAPPPHIKPPPMMLPTQLPTMDISIPEEPENVVITRQWAHPETGMIMATDQEERMLVPTGCRRPQYLNPFETKVEFQDALPKDEALQSQLYAGYQSNGWVDEQWCRARIPEIASDMVELEKRMKARKDVEQRMEPKSAYITRTGSTTSQTQYQGELAPSPEKLGQVPGQGGNPVDMMKQQGGQ